LPSAPRPFEAEVLGGWIGRLAASPLNQKN
jgi:hypothetical protein